MIDYSKSKIYTIRSQSDTGLIYVGSTTQPLSKRWGEHKGKSRVYPLRLLYRTINNEWDDWHIELHQLCPCNSKEELQQKEREVIRLIGNLNMTGNLNMRGTQNVNEKISQDIDDTIKKTSDKYLEKQREYTRRSRAKDPDELRRKYADYQREYRARVKVDIQSIARMPDNCNGYQEIQSITLPAGEVRYI